MPGGINEPADLAGRQHRVAVDQYQMQPDLEARQTAGARHRIRCRRRRDHQAGAAEDAVAAGLFDRLVDRNVAAEIVSRDDQPPELVSQGGSLRAKRSNLAEIASSPRSSQ